MIENKLRVDAESRGVGRGWARWGMGIKEGTCCDEHWVMYGIVESLYYTPEINITQYVNYTGIKTK